MYSWWCRHSARALQPAYLWRQQYRRANRQWSSRWRWSESRFTMPGYPAIATHSYFFHSRTYFWVVVEVLWHYWCLAFLADWLMLMLSYSFYGLALLYCSGSFIFTRVEWARFWWLSWSWWKTRGPKRGSWPPSKRLSPTPDPSWPRPKWR